MNQVLFEDIEYINLDSESKHILNEGVEEQEYLKQNQTINQIKSDQTMLINEENKVKPSPIDNYLENRVYVENYITITGPQPITPIINTDNLLTFNIQKPKIKMNEQEIEPKKYDIVTTVKNKLHINNKKVYYTF